jgi:hypothetical protein
VIYNKSAIIRGIVVLLLNLDDIAHPDLRSVAHNILIMLKIHLALLLIQSRFALAVVDDLAVGNLQNVGKSDGVFVVGTAAATAFDTVVRLFQIFYVICLVQLLLVTENDLSYHHEESILLTIATIRIGKTLFKHVREVVGVSGGAI